MYALLMNITNGSVLKMLLLTEGILIKFRLVLVHYECIIVYEDAF